MANKKTAVKKKAPIKKVTNKPAVKKEKAPQTLVISFSEDTRELLRSLIATLAEVNTSSNTVPAKPKKAVTKKEETVEDAEEETKAAPQKNQSEKTSSTKKADNTVSLTSIRELINEKVGEGKMQDVVALLSEHGASNASSLKEENYEPFYNALKEL